MYNEIKNRLKCELSEKRYNHTLAVQKLGEELAVKYNISKEKATLACLLHDITKEKNVEYQLQILRSSDIIIDNLWLKNTALLHSVTASVVAKEYTSDKEILDAIRYHTTGKADMTMLEKIVYVADACSYDRNYQDAETIRNTAFENIDKALFLIASFTIISNVKKGKLIDMQTINCYNDILIRR
ncbi:MAG: bis(5'-nucleosyl)-tetraphosphatase (symmetrical) YqeK [Oscillospiraceae bacterium]